MTYSATTLSPPATITTSTGTTTCSYAVKTWKEGAEVTVAYVPDWPTCLGVAALLNAAESAKPAL